jgi:hypothetical protein
LIWARTSSSIGVRPKHLMSVPAPNTPHHNATPTDMTIAKLYKERAEVAQSASGELRSAAKCYVKANLHLIARFAAHVIKKIQSGTLWKPYTESLGGRNGTNIYQHCDQDRRDA